MRTIKMSSRAIKSITFCASEAENGNMFYETIYGDDIETKSILEGIVMPHLFAEAYNEMEEKMNEFIAKNKAERFWIMVEPISKRAKAKTISFRSKKFNENNNIVFLA